MKDLKRQANSLSCSSVQASPGTGRDAPTPREPRCGENYTRTLQVSADLLDLKAAPSHLVPLCGLRHEKTYLILRCKPTCRRVARGQALGPPIHENCSTVSCNLYPYCPVSDFFSPHPSPSHPGLQEGRGVNVGFGFRM